MDYWKKFVGLTNGSSQINPEERQDTGLQYLNKTILNFLLTLSVYFSIYSMNSLVLPYGLFFCFINNIFKVVILDDCSSCSEKIIPILEKMIKNKIDFYKASLNDINSLEKPFKEHNFYAVIHFAGKKSVNESIDKPLL